jgi:hypothetical protein
MLTKLRPEFHVRGLHICVFQISSLILDDRALNPVRPIHMADIGTETGIISI